MNPRLLALLVVLCAIGWWNSPVGPQRQRAVAFAEGPVRCPMPPVVGAFGAPLQSALPGRVGPFRLQVATLTPLAGFSVDARVLSRRDYDRGRESDLSPTDLALGWGRMREDAVLHRLEISQAGRWYRYRWSDNPPLPPGEIVRSSANMHLIPADAGAADALAAVRKGDRVRIDGWLVQAEAGDGWTWRSSLSREDSGEGACEVIYVCSIRRL